MYRPLALGTSALALWFLLLQPVTAMADPPAHARNENSARQRGYDDDRHHGDGSHHYQPRRDYVVYHLPRPRVVHHRGHRYYYSRGEWYRPHGPGFVVWDPRVRGYVVIDRPYRRW